MPLQKSRRSTWILLGGISAAVVVLAAGQMNTHRLKGQAERVHAARVACITGVPIEALDKPDVVATLEKAEDDCLKNVGTAPDPETIGRSERWSRVAAATIAIVSGLPWAWYFLLRRVAELGAAFSGNPPGK
jgi:hypothetical protein